MPVVIIGAGPSGLYLAIQLKEKGIDAVVYDPRAGDYTRPGFLNEIPFHQMKRALAPGVYSSKEIKNMDFTKLEEEPGNFIGQDPYTLFHIKDLERKLYVKAKTMGIDIQNYKFIELYSDEATGKHGVVIDVHGEKTKIPAEYVFDCTGRKRTVIQEVNRLIPDSPMQLETVVEPPIPRHFTAYVEMSEADFHRLQSKIQEPYSNEQWYGRSISKLYELGWDKLAIPQLKIQNFGRKNADSKSTTKKDKKIKAYFLLQAPDNFPKEKEEEWVKTVLGSYVEGGVAFNQIPRDVSQTKKPRFNQFTLGGQALEQVAFKASTLPMVLAVGDAQIDFNNSLGHGLSNGILRTNALVNLLQLQGDKIHNFESDAAFAEAYFSVNQYHINYHKQELQEAATQLKETLRQAEDQGFVTLSEWLQHHLEEATTLLPQALKKDITLYHRLVSLEKTYLDWSKLDANPLNEEDLASKLGGKASILEVFQTLHKELGEVIADFSSKIQKEKGEDLLSRVIEQYSFLSNYYYKKGDFQLAFQSYETFLRFASEKQRSDSLSQYPEVIGALQNKREAKTSEDPGDVLSLRRNSLFSKQNASEEAKTAPELDTSKSKEDKREKPPI